MHAVWVQGNDVVGLMDATGLLGDKNKYPPCKEDQYCQYKVGSMGGHNLMLGLGMGLPNTMQWLGGTRYMTLFDATRVLKVYHHPTNVPPWFHHTGWDCVHFVA